MGVYGVVRDCSYSIQNYCYKTQQTVCSFAKKIHILRNDSDFFYKISLVALNAIQLSILLTLSVSHLARFASVLTAVYMHDFFRFLKYPYNWFFPISVESIDEKELFKTFENEIYRHLVTFGVGVNPLLIAGHQFENESRLIARSCIQKQLEEMAKNNDAYRNKQEFINVLQRRLHSVNFYNDLKHCDIKSINLDALKRIQLDVFEVKLKHIPFFKRLTNWNWAIVDVASIVFNFKQWNFIDTAKYAEKIGQNKFFYWLPLQSLEKWIIGLVCSGFLLTLVEAIRKWHDEKLTDEEKSLVKSDIVISAFESILYCTIFSNMINKTNIDKKAICCLAIFAKSLGALCRATIVTNKYFA